MRVDVTEYNPCKVQWNMAWVPAIASHLDELRGLLNDGFEPYAVTEGTLWLRQRVHSSHFMSAVDDPA